MLTLSLPAVVGGVHQALPDLELAALPLGHGHELRHQLSHTEGVRDRDGRSRRCIEGEGECMLADGQLSAESR